MSIDWTETERDGWTVRAELHPDLDATPSEYECYTPKQVAAWNADEWQFVIVTVAVSREDIDVELGHASLGAVEYGWLPITDDNDVLVAETRHIDPLTNGTVTEVADEAIADGLAKLAQLCAEAARTVS